MKHLINDTFKKLEEGLYKQPTILFANDRPKVLWNTVTKPGKEFKVKEVNSKEDIVSEDCDVIYGVKDDGSVVIKAAEPIIPTKVWYKDGGYKEFNIEGEIKCTPTSYGACYATAQIDNITNAVKIEFSNAITSIGHDAFIYCSSITSVNIPNSITSIGNYAFSACESLTSIGPSGSGAALTIPDSVTIISDGVFQSCRGLTSVTIPNSVTSIGSWAFGYCSSLISVTIGSGITSIGNYVFGECSGLTSITIPNSVTSIGDYTFGGCSGLTSVTYNGTIEQWNAITKGTNWNYSVPSICIVHCTDGECQFK